MKRRKKSAVFLCIVTVLLCLALTALYTAAFIWGDDTRPPVISMTTDTLDLSVTATDAEMLTGVTAVDARDGDVTDSLIVQGVDRMEEGGVIVTYAAFDSAGNVAKATRTLHYTDYQPPRITLNDALVFETGTSVDVLGRVEAHDMIDGNISRLVKADLVSNTGSLSYPGAHKVEFRVTNSLGDVCQLTLPVDVVAAGMYNSTVELSDYLVYLPVGSDFSARRYLEGMKLGLGEELVEDTSAMNVSIDSNVRMSVPGVYSVRYTVSYTRDTMKYVGYTCLNVVVEE